MRIGILGGTFDPIHNGHLYMAKKLLRKLSLDKIIFIPTYKTPHKDSAEITPSNHRFNMVKLAIENNKELEISDMEIKRRGKSYSVETLRRLRHRYGWRTEIFFITGSDSLRDIDKWKNLDEILRLAKFVIVKRPHFRIKNLPKGSIVLHIGAKDIEGTEIRDRIRARKPIDRRVPYKVKEYIERHGLYR